MAFGTKAALHNLCRQKEKEAAMQFFLSNRVPEELERLLNDAARERPKDVFGYLSERLSELSRPPSVARLVANEGAYDSSFDRALVVRLYCTVNGREKVRVLRTARTSRPRHRHDHYSVPWPRVEGRVVLACVRICAWCAVLHRACSASHACGPLLGSH